MDVAIGRSGVTFLATLTLIAACSTTESRSRVRSHSVSSLAGQPLATRNSDDGLLEVSFSPERKHASGPSGSVAQTAEFITETHAERLADFEHQALQHPELRRMWYEYQAALAKVRYVGELPDPSIGANLFAEPIETAAGSQRANLTLSQMLPWLSKLDAQQQRACFEAAAMGQDYAARRLEIVAQIRTLWYRMYVLAKQVEVNEDNLQLLESLLDVANAEVVTGGASLGDVLAGTVEHAKIQQQVVVLRQQLVSVKTQMNRLIGREAALPIHAPASLEVYLPDWDTAMLRGLAWSRQPDIEAARIRVQASRWGVELARLKRRPDFTLGVSWFAIDNNRPLSNIVDVGQDAWSVGAMMTLPLHEQKYDAIEHEARWKHSATHASVDEVSQRYDALLVDLWEQARAAHETASLYTETIIPDAKRTLEADQESFRGGSVEFDRVIRDFRTLLTLQVGYHESLGRLAIALAKINQAVGVNLPYNVAPARQEDAVPLAPIPDEIPAE